MPTQLGIHPIKCKLADVLVGKQCRMLDERQTALSKLRQLLL
jgi:hypothetical protein